MGKKDGGGNGLLKLLLFGGIAFLGYEYFFNKGGQYDYVSKVLAGRARARYVRGNIEWGDRYYIQ